MSRRGYVPPDPFRVVQAVIILMIIVCVFYTVAERVLGK